MKFFERFTKSPRRIGSVTPSSKFLTKAMLDKVDWENANFIAELGAGTGVFTREIIKRAKPDAKILVFEIDPALQKMIRDEHPNHKGLSIHSDAQELQKYMNDNGIEKLDFIISSLPFTVLPPKMTMRILDSVVYSLKPEGRFIAYQYSSLMKHVLQKKFSDIKTSFVPLNIPPAFVYDCQNKIKRVHLMGLGGAGMSALAKLLKAHGYEVTGCDLKEPHYDLDNIPCSIGHSRKHIEQFKPNALILSSAVSHDNPEVISAKNKGIKIFSRAEALSSLFNKYYGIGIAGAHGKTTTSSMTGLIFLHSELNPTIYVGANVPDIGSNAVSGNGKYFIAELDESDGTFELFHPSIAIITNADWDHVDHYKTRDEVIKAFTRFSDGRKDNGILILCGEDEGASKVFELCKKSKGKIIRYGWGKNFDWGAYDIVKNHGGGISCKISHNGHEIGVLELSVSGEHNILNALAAISAAEICGVDFETSAKILKNFHGSERRMQIKGTTSNNILIMDDYAHHPSEIKATLNAVKGIYPERRIVVVYQPHRFSRTAMFAPEIAKALSMADEIFLMPVFSAGEKELSHSSSNEIIKSATKKITPVNFDNALEIIESSLKPQDLLLTMGAGDVYTIGENILKK